uniref:Ty3 transposon capsid-like protein domain-containing protein n=1 Tax=Heliothis virescens TaxID=7102 RepID=A0A2A4JBB0_HELVI
MSSLKRSRSFAQAAFSFDGTRDYEKIETFLTFARKYKAYKNISDTDALQTVYIILKDEAKDWWDRTRDNISTWADFESQLRRAFLPKKPAYVVFQELSELRQKPDELTQRFVAKQRALFDQLEPPLPEVVQLDMMYGFLHPKIQEQIPRKCIESFEGLLEAAKAFEQENINKPQVKTPENRTGRKRVRCSFCKNFGHVAEVCRKRQKLTIDDSASGTSIENLEPAPQTAIPQSPAPSASQEPRNTLSTVDGKPRFMIEISIGTAKELAVVDSSIKTSLASFKFYSYLKSIGFHFQEENSMAEGVGKVAKSQDALKGRIPVKVRDRCVLTTFVVFPDARENKSLLGTEFIADGRINLNLQQKTWNFIDEPDVHYNLIPENYVINDEN